MGVKFKQLTTNYLSSWWMPSCIAIGILVLLVASTLMEWWMPLQYIVDLLTIAAILGILAASVVNFIRKRWLDAIVNLLLFPVLLVFSAVIMLFASTFGLSGDGFADKLVIPSNIEVSEPLKSHEKLDSKGQKTKVATGIHHGKASIVLWESSQPGIYESEVWASPGEPGAIYLKAYEVTHNTTLSPSELKEDTNKHIDWSDDPKQIFPSNAKFTIYEGDWGKPYAACFEVWFVPDSGKPERKLLERVFKIEGWQR